MENGIDSFYFSVDEVIDKTHTVLASGFLGAIQSFTSETRASNIDILASKHEIFIFDQFSKADTQIVAVFDHTIQLQVGREILSRVKEEIIQSGLLEAHASVGLSEKDEKKLRKKIEKIAKAISSVDYQIEAAKEITKENPDINLMLIYDYHRDTIHFRNPKQLKKNKDEVESQSKALRAFHRSIIPLIKTLEMGSEFKIMTIESYDYAFALSKYRTLLTICISEQPSNPEKIYNIPFQIMSLPSFTFYQQVFDDLNTKSRWVQSGKYLQPLSGSTLHYMAGEKITKGLELIDELTEAFGLDEYKMVCIYADTHDPSMLQVMRNYTRDELNVVLFQN